MYLCACACSSKSDCILLFYQLIPLDYAEDKSAEKKPTTAEEKREKIKGLIESIPTAKDELFGFPLDWSIVDQVS